MPPENVKNCLSRMCGKLSCTVLRRGKGNNPFSLVDYTSELYRNVIRKYGIQQSMNSAGGRCHDNARCASMWARLKEELLYDRYDTSKMMIAEIKRLFGDISSVIGITEEFVRPMMDYLQ